MKILVVGSGAREHALCWRLHREPEVGEVICGPGNAGVARSIPVVDLDALAPDAVIDLVRREHVDLTVVGPEAPLAAGLADRMQADGLPVFGPTRAAAQLETSKAFAKDFMRRHRVPTARYRVCTSIDEALDAIRSGEFGDSMVVKADGLAAGKGVVVADARVDAEAAAVAMLRDRTFGEAGSRVVIEERLTGPEVSFFVVADGERYVPLLSAQDHKRIFDGDQGPNTGGMGAFAPSGLTTSAVQDRIEREIVRPVLQGMAEEGAPYRGFLYCGLMITHDGPKVIEFNVRFGDPEAQVVLPLLDEPLAPMLMAAAAGQLRSRAPHTVAAHSTLSAPRTAHLADRTAHPALRTTHENCAVGVVLAAAGYPGDVRPGDRLEGLDTLARECPDALVFFAGVKARDGGLVTSGGRVMTIVSRGATFERAIARAYDAVSRVSFAGMQFRRDIGRKALTSLDQQRS